MIPFALSRQVHAKKRSRPWCSLYCRFHGLDLCSDIVYNTTATPNRIGEANMLEGYPLFSTLLFHQSVPRSRQARSAIARVRGKPRYPIYVEVVAGWPWYPPLQLSISRKSSRAPDAQLHYLTRENIASNITRPSATRIKTRFSLRVPALLSQRLCLKRLDVPAPAHNNRAPPS